MENNFEEDLINCVQNAPHLWDKTNADYKDCKLARRSWHAIAETLQSDAATCEQRWRNLRDYRKKALKKAETKSGDAGGRKVKWKYADLLSFLGNHDERAAESSVFPPSEESGDESKIGM